MSSPRKRIGGEIAAGGGFPNPCSPPVEEGAAGVRSRRPSFSAYARKQGIQIRDASSTRKGCISGLAARSGSGSRVAECTICPNLSTVQSRTISGSQNPLLLPGCGGEKRRMRVCFECLRSWPTPSPRPSPAQAGEGAIRRCARARAYGSATSATIGRRVLTARCGVERGDIVAGEAQRRRLDKAFAHVSRRVPLAIGAVTAARCDQPGERDLGGFGLMSPAAISRARRECGSRAD